MKTSSLLVAFVIRIAAVMSLLGGAAVPHAHAQVSFLQPLSFLVMLPRPHPYAPTACSQAN
jgi:hypothetical protein